MVPRTGVPPGRPHRILKRHFNVEQEQIPTWRSRQWTHPRSVGLSRHRNAAIHTESWLRLQIRAFPPRSVVAAHFAYQSVSAFVTSATECVPTSCHMSSESSALRNRPFVLLSLVRTQRLSAHSRLHFRTGFCDKLAEARLERLQESSTASRKGESALALAAEAGMRYRVAPFTRHPAAQHSPGKVRTGAFTCSAESRATIGNCDACH